MTAASPDGLDAGPEETTLAEDDWPVSELYRVDPIELDAASREPDTSERPTAIARRPVRWRPPYPFDDTRAAPLALVFLAAIVLASAAGWYIARGDEPAEATPAADAATGSTPSGTTPTTTPPPSAAAKRPLPDVTGLDLQEARDLLEGAGLRARVRRVGSDQPAGSVLGQQPGAGARLADGAIVTLTVVKAPEGATVPDVVGEPASTARRELQKARLRVEIERVASSKPAGTVLRQSPDAGMRVGDGAAVSLQVAKPQPATPATIDVPRVTGLDVADARARLADLGLRSTVNRVDSERPAGTVLEQSPSAGGTLERGQPVALTVSSGPAAVAVPDVVGLDEASARLQLEVAGFEVTTTDEQTSDPAEDGQVVGQSPTAGTQRKPGTLVTLRIARLS